MDRNREARKSTMAASANSLSRRPHRSNSVRDSPGWSFTHSDKLMTGQGSWSFTHSDKLTTGSGELLDNPAARVLHIPGDTGSNELNKQALIGLFTDSQVSAVRDDELKLATSKQHKRLKLAMMPPRRVSGDLLMGVEEVSAWVVGLKNPKVFIQIASIYFSSILLVPLLA